MSDLIFKQLCERFKDESGVSVSIQKSVEQGSLTRVRYSMRYENAEGEAVCTTREVPPVELTESDVDGIARGLELEFRRWLATIRSTAE